MKKEGDTNQKLNELNLKNFMYSYECSSGLNIMLFHISEVSSHHSDPVMSRHNNILNPTGNRPVENIPKPDVHEFIFKKETGSEKDPTIRPVRPKLT